MSFDPAVFNALLRTDFRSFFHKCFDEVNGGAALDASWHLDALCYELDRCWRRQNKRLIINVQPRSLKSLVTSIAWPAFVLGHRPSERIIAVSYGTDLALKHARDFRRVVNSAWYLRLFPEMRIFRDTNDELETTRGGYRLALSIGGPVTGRGANIIVIDDPLKSDEGDMVVARDKVNAYFRRTLYSRLDNKADGVIVLVMQRLHEDDLSGLLLKQPGWQHLSLPSIATQHERVAIGRDSSGQVKYHHREPGDLLQPQRETRASLDETRVTMTSLQFEAQYQQSPVPLVGNIVKREYLQYYDRDPVRTADIQIVQSWDTAVKGDPQHDYSVCTTWLFKKDTHYLLDVVRRQCSLLPLVQLAGAQFQRYRPDIILVEDKGAGTNLIEELRDRYQIRAVARQPEGDKVSRFSTAALAFEKRLVYLPREAPWLGAFEHELLGFPKTKFDDQVDSVSQYLIWARERSRVGLFNYEFLDTTTPDPLATLHYYYSSS